MDKFSQLAKSCGQLSDSFANGQRVKVVCIRGRLLQFLTESITNGLTPTG